MTVALVAGTIPQFSTVLGNLWDWVAGVFARIGDVSIYWLVLALKTTESAFIGLGWRNILRAAYPRDPCPSRPPGARRREARRSTR